MKKIKIDYIKFIEDNIKKCDISYRGGSLVVDVSGLLSDATLEKIADNGDRAEAGCYQNYLGGGIAGSIQSGRSFDVKLLNDEEMEKYAKFAETVKQYFYAQNEGGGDEYMVQNVNSYKQNQKLPASYPGL